MTWKYLFDLSTWRWNLTNYGNFTPDFQNLHCLRCFLKMQLIVPLTKSITESQNKKLKKTVTYHVLSLIGRSNILSFDLTKWQNCASIDVRSQKWQRIFKVSDRICFSARIPSSEFFDWPFSCINDCFFESKRESHKEKCIF